MLSRRGLIKSSILASLGTLISVCSADLTTGVNSKKLYMPDEGEPHKQTWMAFIASDEIWRQRQVLEVQRNLAEIAKTIANYEAISMLVRQQDYELAVELLGGLESHPFPIQLIEFTINDLWIRDTGPSFVIDENGNKAAINFNFNGWGEDQAYQYDAKVAHFVAQQAGVTTIKSSLVLEGGWL